MATNRFNTGIAWMRGKLRTHASDLATYARGDSTASLRMWHGSTGFQQTQGDGGFITVQTDDWLCYRTDLKPGGTESLPLPGDTITKDGVTYRVSDVAGDGCYRFSDSDASIIRIHTTRI